MTKRRVVVYECKEDVVEGEHGLDRGIDGSEDMQSEETKEDSNSLAHSTASAQTDMASQLLSSV